jgi:hypothetical protein
MSYNFFLSGIGLRSCSILSAYCSSMEPCLVMIASRTKDELSLYPFILIVHLMKFCAGF